MPEAVDTLTASGNKENSEEHEERHVAEEKDIKNDRSKNIYKISKHDAASLLQFCTLYLRAKTITCLSITDLFAADATAFPDFV